MVSTSTSRILNDGAHGEKLRSKFDPLGIITSAEAMCDDKDTPTGFGSFVTPVWRWPPRPSPRWTTSRLVPNFYGFLIQRCEDAANNWRSFSATGSARGGPPLLESLVVPRLVRRTTLRGDFPPPGGHSMMVNQTRSLLVSVTIPMFPPRPHGQPP